MYAEGFLPLIHDTKGVLYGSLMMPSLTGCMSLNKELPFGTQSPPWKQWPDPEPSSVPTQTPHLPRCLEGVLLGLTALVGSRAPEARLPLPLLLRCGEEEGESSM